MPPVFVVSFLPNNFEKKFILILLYVLKQAQSYKKIWELQHVMAENAKDKGQFDVFLNFFHC
jgi:hypothetical protein